MADSAPYGVYVSIRRPTGELVSINRASLDEVRADLEGILGEDADDFFKKFATPELESPIVPSPAPDLPSGSTGGSGPVASTPAIGVDDLPADGFEKCEKCGTLKDKWVPPGFSEKKQKPYAGFWTCPAWNPKTH
jgi:hypothetical protein